MTVSSANKESPIEINYVWRANLIRFILPIVLFVVVSSLETPEHLSRIGRLDTPFFSEITLFGVVGPLAVFLSITYIISLLKKLIKARAETEQLNRNLELLVKERTATLATRNIELAQANTQLQKLDQMKSDFVSLVSHELRAPLTNLNGALELTLQNVQQIPLQTQRVLGLMALECQRLTSFVQNLLDMSRLEAGRLKLTLGPVAVIPLLTRAVATVLPDTRRPIQWQVTTHLPPVWADEVYLEEIIRNLLINADKYTPPTTPIDIAVLVEEHCLKIMLTDYGPGVPMDAQGKIFERFYRQENGDQVSNRGWGLGLYFAKALTEAQGGCLKITSPVHASSQNPGSCFRITLPLTEEVPDDA